VESNVVSAGQGIKELVGRLMVDPDYLAALVRDPATVLADYNLSGDERAALLRAVAKHALARESQMTRVVMTAVAKRWAT
jgi:hypothetical protein